MDRTRTIATGTVVDKKHYLHRDYLGSIIAISDETGAAVERRQFDAWGNLAKLQQNGIAVALPTDGTGAGLMMLDRGYTSHEHLAEVGLIHMNGRLYDPVLRSFLMPDNFIQQPENTQNYNRYAYVLNNPLLYTDPSGEFIPFLAAVAIGAGVAALTYTMTALLADVPFTLGGLAKATFIGAASASVTFGIGSGAENLFTNFFSRAAFQAVAHGTFQGGMTAISGGKFWSGFAAGAISSIAASAWSGGSSMDALGKNGHAIAGTGMRGLGAGTGDLGMIAFGTVSGGAGAKLTGGNFWQGAATGLVVSGLNHYVHQMSKPETTVAGIYGAGGEEASGNPDLKALVEGQGGRMFSSSVGGGDDEIIAYLKEGFEKGNQLKIYGHSRGGAAAVRIANKLGAMNVHISEITLYDPVGMYGGGDFVFNYPNVMKVTNYYQRNPVDGVAFWADNPFKGSPVSGNFQWPAINNVNLTGVYYKPGVLMSHLNITRYAIKNP